MVTADYSPSSLILPVILSSAKNLVEVEASTRRKILRAAQSL